MLLRGLSEKVFDQSICMNERAKSENAVFS